MTLVPVLLILAALAVACHGSAAEEPEDRLASAVAKTPGPRAEPKPTGQITAGPTPVRQGWKEPTEKSSAPVRNRWIKPTKMSRWVVDDANPAADSEMNPREIGDPKAAATESRAANNVAEPRAASNAGEATGTAAKETVDATETAAKEAVEATETAVPEAAVSAAVADFDAVAAETKKNAGHAAAAALPKRKAEQEAPTLAAATAVGEDAMSPEHARLSSSAVGASADSKKPAHEENAETDAAAAQPTVRPLCFEPGVMRVPLDMMKSPMTYKDDAESCQAHCQTTEGCRFFTFTPLDKGCHITDVETHVRYSDDELRRMPLFISGPQVCEKDAIPSWTRELVSEYESSSELSRLLPALSGNNGLFVTLLASISLLAGLGVFGAVRARRSVSRSAVYQRTRLEPSYNVLLRRDLEYGAQ